ncbi:unnamed protein product [Ectocarpus sp. 8 AP-2014]
MSGAPPPPSAQGPRTQAAVDTLIFIPRKEARTRCLSQLAPRPAPNHQVHLSRSFVGSAWVKRGVSAWIYLYTDMWRPDEVVPQHKRRAVALWTILIGGIIFYSSYLLYKAVRKRENPDASIELSNTVFEYPDIWVCLYVNYGCDEWELENECMTSAAANMTGWGNSSAVYYPDGEYEQEIHVEGRETPDNGWCLEYQTSNITRFLGQERNASYYLDYLLLDMYWYPGGLEADSTTCVVEGWKTHK